MTNLKSIGKFLVKKTLGKIGQEWKSDTWTNSLTQIVKVFNAFYAPWTNQFVIPAGYLHQFNFNSGQPMDLNYAATASTVGHEMVHGFDSTGRNYDKEGKSLLRVSVYQSSLIFHIFNNFN